MCSDITNNHPISVLEMENWTLSTKVEKLEFEQNKLKDRIVDIENRS